MIKVMIQLIVNMVMNVIHLSVFRKGGTELKDRCHVMIYKHPPRRGNRHRNKELEANINCFCLNDE